MNRWDRQSDDCENAILGACGSVFSHLQKQIRRGFCVSTCVAVMKSSPAYIKTYAVHQMDATELLESKNVLGMELFLQSKLYEYLETAVQNNDAAMIEMLISRQVVNPFRHWGGAFTTKGNSLLIKAIVAHAFEAALQLMKCGASVHEEFESCDVHETPLRSCLDNEKEFVEKSCLPVLEALINNGALRGTVEFQKPVAEDALELAVALNSSILVNLFVDHGANVDFVVADDSCNHLVAWAAKCGHIEAMLSLVSRGAKLDGTDDHDAGILFHFFNAEYDTRAGKNKNSEKYAKGSGFTLVDIVKELIAAGADPLKADVEDVTPLGALNFADICDEQYFEIAQVFLLHGATMNDVVYTPLENSDIRTGDVLDLVIERMEYERVKYWLEKAASADYDVNFLTEENLNVSLYHLILDNLDIKDSLGLYMYTEDSIIDIASLLLRFGALMTDILPATVKRSTVARRRVLDFFLIFCLQNDGTSLDTFVADLSNLPPQQRSLVTHFLEDRTTAGVMCNHPRLGSESQLRTLPVELLEYITKCSV